MHDVYESVYEKVLSIFREGFRDRAKRLDGSVMATPAMDTIADALTEEYGLMRADEIALHMSDWNWDAAFIVAMHLYPERFTKDEVEAGLGLFLCHAPNHIREACRLTDTFVWESFE